MDEANPINGAGEPAEIPAETQLVEVELRKALRHVPAPEGLTARVMERVAAREQVRTQRRTFASFVSTHKRAAWWTALAASLLLFLGGDMAYVYRVHELQKQAEAREQVDRAMELANRALAQVHSNMERSGDPFVQFALNLTK